MGKQCVVWAALICLLGAIPGMAVAADSAVILTYSRLDDDRVAALNTTSEQFASHLTELKSGGSAVLPLADIVTALRAGKPLPDKAVALTLDDGNTASLARLMPQLRKAGLPLTVFVATDEVDRGGETAGWARLRELVAQGVTIGSQGAARLHMAKAGSEAVTADLARAAERFRQELGSVPTLFVWPWGETSSEAETAVRRAGYVAAFGQHSGAAWAKADPFFLPRFAASGAYGETERFRLAIRSLPLPAVDITPDDPLLKANPPAFGFTLAEEIPGIDGLACFTSHLGQVKVEHLGPRMEIRMPKPIPSGRGRLNCTLPTLEGRWRWFGWQFVAP